LEIGGNNSIGVAFMKTEVLELIFNRI